MTFLPPPPGPGGGAYVGPYATSSVPLAPMRSLRGLWMAIIVLFALVGAADAMMAAALFHRASLLDDVAQGSFVFGDLLDADDAVQTALIGHGVVAVALAVTFIVWQFRHAKNAEALGERGGLGPGWAIGGWFIPVANYVLPGVQIHQSSRLSDPRVAGQPPGTKGKGAPVVIVWAVLFALAAVLFVSGGGLRPTDEEGNIQINGADDIRSAASGDRTAAMGMLLFVGAALAGGMMVFSLSAKQTMAYERRLAVPAAGPPPGSAFTIPTHGAAPAPPVWSQPPAPPPPAWSDPPAPAPPAGSSPDPTTQWGTPPP